MFNLQKICRLTLIPTFLFFSAASYASIVNVTETNGASTAGTNTAIIGAPAHALDDIAINTVCKALKYKVFLPLLHMVLTLVKA